MIKRKRIPVSVALLDALDRVKDYNFDLSEAVESAIFEYLSNYSVYNQELVDLAKQAMRDYLAEKAQRNNANLE